MDVLWYHLKSVKYPIGNNNRFNILFEVARIVFRGGSRAAATSKMKRFVIIVNGFQPLAIITKRSSLDVAAAQDPPLEPLFVIIPMHVPRKRPHIILILHSY